jgi:hypothetical protein
MVADWDKHVAEQLGVLNTSVKALTASVETLNSRLAHAEGERNDLKSEVKDVKKILHSYTPDMKRCRQLRVFGVVGLALIMTGGAIVTALSHFFELFRHFKLSILVLVFCMAAATIALAQDNHRQYAPHSWISKEGNGQGMSCCHETDIKRIPYAAALRLGVGSIYTGRFPSGVHTVTVTAVHPSHDPYSYITVYGCVFKPEFM